MVVEEKYVGQQDIPALQAIGWEGQYNFYIFYINFVNIDIFKQYLKNVE